MYVDIDMFTNTSHFGGYFPASRVLSTKHTLLFNHSIIVPVLKTGKQRYRQ